MITYAQLAENIIIGLRWIRILSHSTLDDTQTKTPDITLNAVGSTTRISTSLCNSSTSYALWGHVALTANVGLCNAGNKIPTDPEITNLDLTSRIDQNICWLDISMYDVVLVFQYLETHDGRKGNLAKHTLRHPITIQLVNRTTVHILHTDVHCAFLEEGAVEVYNEGRYTTM